MQNFLSCRLFLDNLFCALVKFLTKQMVMEHGLLKKAWTLKSMDFLMSFFKYGAAMDLLSLFICRFEEHISCIAVDSLFLFSESLGSIESKTESIGIKAE